MRLSDILSIPCLADNIIRAQVYWFRRRHRERISVAFAINRNYVRPLGTALTSLLLNNPGPVEAIILSADLDEAAKAPLLALPQHFPELTFRFQTVDMRRLEGLQMNHGLDHISRETFFRYLLPELLPDLDRVLYLDADLIVCAALDTLWATPLEGAYAAGVEDSYVRRSAYDRELGLTGDEVYVNAGVLLLNLKAMRQANITEQLFELSAATALRFMDQDAINLAFRGRIRGLPERYNVTADSLRRKIRPFRGHPVILHYTSPWKPWQSRIPLAFWRHEAYRRCFERLAGLAPVIRVGLLVDEFFGAFQTAYGGYGFLVREGICRLIPNADIQVDVLLGKARSRHKAKVEHVDSTLVYQLPRHRRPRRRWLNRANYDLFLSIEGKNIKFLRDVPRKRLIFWIQGLRPQHDGDEMNIVQRLPEPPCGNATAYDMVHQLVESGRVRFITQAHDLVPKAFELYRLPASTPVEYLPNPQALPYPPEVVASHPKQNKVVFLGRIESVKRGWLFCEIAKAMPDLTFYVIGQSTKNAARNEALVAPYRSLPNLHFLGHLEGEAKYRQLLDAKVLVNTSIHETLPIFFLEALACGTLLVSNRNPDHLTERFGRYVGPVLGDGFEGVPRFVAAIRELLAMDEAEAQALRAQAVAYIQEVHSPAKCQARLRELIQAEAQRYRSQQ